MGVYSCSGRGPGDFADSLESMSEDTVCAFGGAGPGRLQSVSFIGTIIVTLSPLSCVNKLEKYIDSRQNQENNYQKSLRSIGRKKLEN